MMNSICKSFCNQGHPYSLILALLSLTLFSMLFPGWAEARPPTERIINGTDSPSSTGDESVYPWMASLQFDGAHFCGGVLVAPQYVLTAAHCADYVSFVMNAAPDALSRLQIVIGSRDITTAGGTSVEIKGPILHPYYNTLTTERDVALIKLAAPVSITPIPVASQADSALYTPLSTVRILGWGVKNKDFVTPGILQQADVPLRSTSVCNENLGQAFFSGSMICAGTLSTTINGVNQLDGVDACFGDSGGPVLASTGGDEFAVIGITSFGLGTFCASDKTYGVYAKVSQFSDFIMSTPQVTPINYTPPSVTGSVELGRRLVCSGDRWIGEPGTYTYRWVRTPSDYSALPEEIGGATSRTYRITRADSGYAISCEVTSTNTGGSAKASSSARFVPAPDPGPTTPSFGSISCTSKACTITILEGELSSDYKKVSGTIKSSQKRRTGFGNTRTANASAGSGEGWTFTIRRPARRYFSLTAVAIDYQDRVSPPARFLFEVSADRSTFEKVG